MAGNVGRAFRNIEKFKNEKFKQKRKERDKKYYQEKRLEIRKKTNERNLEISKSKNKHCRLCNNLLDWKTKGDYCVEHYPNIKKEKYKHLEDKSKEKKTKIKMNKQLNIGLLYISLHNLLKRKVGVNRYISKKDFFTILGKHFLVPKEIRIVVIKEMEKRGLVKQETKQNIKILDCDLDIKKDVNLWYQKVGIFSIF